MPAAPLPAPARPSAFSRFVRGVFALVALVLIAVAVAAGVILLTDQSAGEKITRVTGDTIDKVVDENQD